MALPIADFISFLQERGVLVRSYQDVYRWSIQHVGEFWSCLWDFLEISGIKSEEHYALDSMKEARFFCGGTLNFAQNLLRGNAEDERLVFVGEDGRRMRFTLQELCERVAAIQQYFRHKGLQPGDRVVAYMPNTPEAVCAMLAVASLGGVWVCAGLELGCEVLSARFEQVEPRFLVTSWVLCPNTRARCDQVIKTLQERLHTLEATVVLPYAGTRPEEKSLGEVLISTAVDDRSLVFPQFPFDHPLYIVFSSGTTGKPKCIVHRAGGVLLQHAKEHVLHCGLTQEDRAFFHSTCSWMMWHWSVSMLMTQATLYMFDGNVFAKGGRALLDMAHEEKLTFFGASASYYDFAVKLRHRLDLSSVRCVTSTGSVLLPKVARALNEDVFPQAKVYSISGGTDLLSCFVIGNQMTPIVHGEIQGAGLGMDVAVMNDQGTAVFEDKGELVCRKPFPSMPLGFFGDANGALYHRAYFSCYENIWTQGDFAMHKKDGTFILYGRSDNTLNPGGVRVGTAEIYALLCDFAWIKESIMTTMLSAGRERMVLLVVLEEGSSLTDEMKAMVRRHLRDKGSPHFVPAYIHQMSDLPRTHNGKLSEKAAKTVLHDGGAVHENLQDPRVLNELAELRALYN